MHVSGVERVKFGALRGPDTVVDHREPRRGDSLTRTGRDSRRGENWRDGPVGGRTSEQAGRQASQCWRLVLLMLHACMSCAVPGGICAARSWTREGRTSSLSRQTCRTAQEARIPCMEGHARTSG